MHAAGQQYFIGANIAYSREGEKAGPAAGPAAAFLLLIYISVAEIAIAQCQRRSLSGDERPPTVALDGRA
jgi:hypothetical protein